MTTPSTSEVQELRAEVYRDAADEWRWRLIHPNGRVLADSGEGYVSKSDAVHGLSVVTKRPIKVTILYELVDDGSDEE